MVLAGVTTYAGAMATSSASSSAGAPSGTVAAVVLAGGVGARLGAGRNKAFLPLHGKPLVQWSLETMAHLHDLGALVLVMGEADAEEVERLPAQFAGVPLEVVVGGATRQESELHALRHLAARIHAEKLEVVLIHDAARPLASLALMQEVVQATRRVGGAIPALPDDEALVVRDALSRSGAGDVAPAGCERSQLLRVQTPQGFYATPLLAAYEAAAQDRFVGTDTASCVERYTDLEVTWVPGEDTNLKVTYGPDVRLAEVAARALGFAEDESVPVAHAVVNSAPGEGAVH